MLPTPSTSHVSFATVYEPAEDSFLLLDTLSSASETAFLSARLSSPPSALARLSPLVLEVGTGSGVIISFLTANAATIFGRDDVLALGVDANVVACQATQETATRAVNEVEGRTSELDLRTKSPRRADAGRFLDCIVADLSGPIPAGAVDVLIFNPPYVPTPELPAVPTPDLAHGGSFDEESYLLSLSYAGGADGMETTSRLLEQLPVLLNQDRGVAYVLLCASNRPEKVKEMITAWGGGWKVETVGSSGAKAGWERLQVVRIWKRV
ncbi:MAG: S-adenosylmethionine-dependent methyltransferase [Piccolia ochrophora]|nr:MAG: S-adenosylmethionine-dependent methyltransferase [Piccolia ochrophora]